MLQLIKQKHWGKTLNIIVLRVYLKKGSSNSTNIS